MPAIEATAPDVNGIRAGEKLPIHRAGTLISGQNLPRGAVLGRITSGRKLTLSLTAASDGSQTPVAILAEACDATGGDKACLYYISGEFAFEKLTVGASHTITTLNNAFEDAGREIVIRNIGAVA